MSGCPYSNWSWKRDCEICACTDAPTNGAVKCDFGYEEDCAIYQANANKED